MAAGFDEIDPQALEVFSSPWKLLAVGVGFVLMFLTVPLTRVILTRLQYLPVRAPTQPAGICPTCGYDLRAAPDRCPGCGDIPARATT